MVVDSGVELVVNSAEDLVAYLLQLVLRPHHLLFEEVTEGEYLQYLEEFLVLPTHCLLAWKMQVNLLVVELVPHLFPFQLVPACLVLGC